MSKQVREYMKRTKEVVPTRGTVHDLGRAITHNTARKSMIIYTLKLR